MSNPMNSTTDHKPETISYFYATATTALDMIEQFEQELMGTPRWRVLRRNSIKHVIKFWKERI